VSSDIQPGDVVVALSASQCLYGDAHDDVDAPGLTGKVARVADVQENNFGVDPGVLLLLSLVGWRGLFCAGCFRKLNDGTDDAELIERIKSCKPIRESVDNGFLESLLLDANGLDPWVEDQLDRLWTEERS
jgi:hypothetical protein